MRNVLRILGAVTALVADVGFAQQKLEIDTKIYPKSMTVTIMSGATLVGTASDTTLPLSVRRISEDGQWLWIWVHKKKVEGWIRRSDVCTAHEAIPYFTTLISSDPIHAYYSRGNAHDELGHLDESIEDSTQLIRLNPTANAYNSRGMSWLAKKEYDIAIADFTDSIRLDPTLTLAHNNRGVAWGPKGEFDKAIVDYTEATAT